MTLLEKKAALGKAIDDLRTANKLSVAEFSKTIGIPVGTIKKWQSGDNTPNIFHLEKIADVYCLDVDYLLGRKTDDILRMDQLTDLLHSSFRFRFCILPSEIKNKSDHHKNN